MQTGYSQLCEAASDAVDAVKLEIPEGFRFLKYKFMLSFKIDGIVKSPKTDVTARK
jgi:hypothetical protein